MSVFYLSQLDDFIENKSEKVISKVKSLQRVGVLWYCVLSRIYGNKNFNPTETDAYIKLFLNACVDLSALASKDGAFFKDTSNYFGLLNLPHLFEEFGDPRKLWEGDREAWMKFVKKYLVSLCNDGDSLQTIMQNIMRRHCFDYLNEDNPYIENQEERFTTSNI